MMSKGGEVSYMLERILYWDNKFSFVDLLQTHPAELSTKYVLEKCAEFGAKKCLLELLNGDKPLPALDAPAPNGVTALACVCHGCPDPQIIDLMLKRCNALPTVNVPCSISLVYALPIQFVLLHLSYMKHLNPWARGNSLIKLIILLCMWETKPILDCAWLLAQYNDSINNIARTFVECGALIQFGALLLIAREKVMAPFDTGLTIDEYLTNEIDSRSKSDIGSEQVEYKNMLIDAQLLLGVFNRAGDDLSSYCRSMQNYVAREDTVADVCELLKKSKVIVRKYDLIFIYFFKEHFKVMSKSSKLVAPPESSNGNWFRAYPAPNYYDIPLEVGVHPNRMLRKMEKCLSSPQPRYMSTTACHIKKISRPLEHAQHLAYTFMKLKKGLRFLSTLV